MKEEVCLSRYIHAPTVVKLDCCHFIIRRGPGSGGGGGNIRFGPNKIQH